MAVLNLRQAGLGLTALAVLLAFGGWLGEFGLDTTATDTADEQTIERKQPDVLGEGVTFSELRPDGSLQYRLLASTIQQFDADRLTRLEAPDLHLTSQRQPPWDVTARHGYLRKRPNPQGEEEDVVFLREDVRMVQMHPRNGRLTLRSETMYVFPDREYAQTDEDVMIDTEVGRTRAAGMIADMATGMLRLSSSVSQRVHTIVLPEQFKKS